MVAVARYRESISKKTKILFSELAKKKSTFILDKGGTYKMNDSNKKIVFVLEKAYAENEDMNI